MPPAARSSSGFLRQGPEKDPQFVSFQIAVQGQGGDIGGEELFGQVAVDGVLALEDAGADQEGVAGDADGQLVTELKEFTEVDEKLGRGRWR